MRARGRPAGFTLVEMLVVLVIIAAASLMAMAAFGGGLRGMQLHSSAKEIAAQLRFARAVAISTGEPQDVVIDPQGRSWRGAKGRSGSLPGEGAVVFTGAGGAQFADADDADGKGVVRFFPDGAATGGRVRLLANGAGWDVDVRWLTGEVVMRRVRDVR